MKITFPSATRHMHLHFPSGGSHSISCATSWDKIDWTQKIRVASYSFDVFYYLFFFLQVTLLLSTSCVYSNNNQSFCCNLPLQFNRFLTLRKTKICAINHIRNPPINIQGPLTSYSALLNQSFTCIKISQWIIHKLSTSPRQSFKRSIRAPWENSGNTKDGLFCYSGIISNQISHDDDVSTSIIQTWILYFMEKKEFEGGKRKRATVVKFGRKAPGRKTTRFCWHG